jgi:serine/threonine protein kinase
MVMSGEITTPPRPFPRNESPDPTAETFGEYFVYEQLGVGGMASVHRAERRKGKLRQRVALKRLLPHAGVDEDLVRLFLDEARLVSSLRHRNIAEIYDFGRVGQEYFLAMELVAGPTLKQLLKHCAATVGIIPYPIAINLLVQVCDALAYAHDLTDSSGKPLQLVHRDVSPSNIVISSNGVTKLIDFGVAKTASSHTQAGIIKGKLGYIAPEYLEDTGLDRRADLWAVGCVAYELLTNKRVFSSDDDLELMRLVRTQQIVPPSFHNPDVPAELDAIVMTALERDPSRRWQNATALRNALAGVTQMSTQADIMEWVEWVFGMASGPSRPVRGSRPLSSVQPSLLAAEPILTFSQLPRPETHSEVRAIPAQRPLPLPSLPTPLPLPSHPTPVPPQPTAPMPVGRSPAYALRPPRQLPVRISAPSIGAAMVARRSGAGRIALPLILIALGLISAFAVPLLYDLLASHGSV